MYRLKHMYLSHCRLTSVNVETAMSTEAKESLPLLNAGKSQNFCWDIIRTSDQVSRIYVYTLTLTKLAWLQLQGLELIYFNLLLLEGHKSAFLSEEEIEKWDFFHTYIYIYTILSCVRGVRD
jgi:hypothetical protein